MWKSVDACGDLEKVGAGGGDGEEGGFLVYSPKQKQNTKIYSFYLYICKQQKTILKEYCRLLYSCHCKLEC